jgi:hypothetical protein
MICENLHLFTDTFGADFTARRASADVASFKAILNNPDLRGRVGNTEAEVRACYLLCVAADIASVKRTDAVTVWGVPHFVVEKRPDGTGMATLVVAPVPLDEDVDTGGFFTSAEIDAIAAASALETATELATSFAPEVQRTESNTDALDQIGDGGAANNHTFQWPGATTRHRRNRNRNNTTQ